MLIYYVETWLVSHFPSVNPDRKGSDLNYTHYEFFHIWIVQPYGSNINDYTCSLVWVTFILL